MAVGLLFRLAATAPAGGLQRATARVPARRCSRVRLTGGWNIRHTLGHRFPGGASTAGSRRTLATGAAERRLEVPSFPSAVLHDVARLSSGWRVHQQLAELAATQTKVHRDDYESICAQHGLDVEEAATLLKSLQGAGVVVRIDGAGLDNTLFLRPDEGVLRTMSSNLDLSYATVDQDRVERLQRVLDKKLALLRPAQQKKEELDGAARRAAHRTIALMLLYLAAQNGVFFYGTFFVWSWDIMEPITYFWGQSFMLLCFAYFIRSEREWGFGGVQERMVDAKRRRRYRREGFDIDKYERDCAAVELYRERIRALEKERI